MLRAEGLALSRGGVPLLADLSFAVLPGEALILTGPNGTGKTTLLRALAGLLPPDGGRIERPETLAYAGHLDGVKPALTVAENLRVWARLHGARNLGPALAAMDLEALRDRRGADLSAGQKRRVGLARLVVTGAPLWLLDEPTVSLDAASVRRFEAMLARHLEGGGAAVVATHLPVPGRVLDLAAFRAPLPEPEDLDW